jgi:eukaryotic-like serine/threonine-protein kinase
MRSVATEREILARAVAAGVLTDRELDELDARLAADATASSYQGRYGARLEELLRSSRIDEATVRRLADSVVGPAPSAPTSPPMLGRYELRELVGVGGNGRVFKAWDRELERHVALKLLRQDRGSAAELLEEARAQARIDHPNICPIYEVGELEGQPYVAMQLIAGRTLKEALPTLPLVHRLSILEQVARAIHQAHERNLVHRDLKPSNLMLEPQDRGFHPYVLDFGLARQIPRGGDDRISWCGGTPGYMAPEQEQGNAADIDRRTDVHALGATLYEALTSTKPAPRPRPGPRAIDPSIPRDLEWISLRALEVRPEHRYPTAAAFADDLAAYLRGDPVTARPSGPAYWLGKKVRKNRLATAAIVVAMVTSVAGFASWLSGLEHAVRKAQVATRLGEQLARLETAHRTARMLPFHDLATDEALQRRRLAMLEASVDRAGEDGEGAGDYALGRAYAWFGELDRALFHLGRAKARGVETTELSAALGEVLGDRYGQALAELGSRPTQDARAAIEAQYRAPALESLRDAVSATPDGGRLTQARIALYEERFDAARKAAEDAFAASPWLFEAPRLVGTIELSVGRKARNSGEPREAVAAFERAREAFATAVHLAASDPESHEGLCRAATERLFVEVYDLADDPGPAFADAGWACERAAKVHTGRVNAWLEISRSRRLYATHLHDRGLAVGEHIDAAITAGERALAIEPKNPRALDTLGNIHRFRGARLAEAGGSPDVDLSRAIELIERGLSIDGEQASIWNDLGNAHSARAAAARLADRADPSAYAEAVAAYQTSIRIQDGGHPSPFINLGALEVDEALGANESERSFHAALAITALEAGLAMHRNDPYAVALLAEARALLAAAELDERGLDAARVLAKRAQTLDPSAWEGMAAEAITEQAAATMAMARQQDPRDALERSLAAWRRAAVLSPLSPYPSRGAREVEAQLADQGRLSPQASSQR